MLVDTGIGTVVDKIALALVESTVAVTEAGLQERFARVLHHHVEAKVDSVHEELRIGHALDLATDRLVHGFAEFLSHERRCHGHGLELQLTLTVERQILLVLLEEVHLEALLHKDARCTSLGTEADLWVAGVHHTVLEAKRRLLVVSRELIGGVHDEEQILGIQFDVDARHRALVEEGMFVTVRIVHVLWMRRELRHLGSTLAHVHLACAAGEPHLAEACVQTAAARHTLSAPVALWIVALAIGETLHL
mmetsp:Transcript_24803/g.62258  ORF Transcript_24803/g.62258 Transcript_24803/m.62258 type:complete len:249 (-) Transcript_24803:437-1183(-)